MPLLGLDHVGRGGARARLIGPTRVRPPGPPDPDRSRGEDEAHRHEDGAEDQRLSSAAADGGGETAQQRTDGQEGTEPEREAGEEEG